MGAHETGAIAARRRASRARLALALLFACAVGLAGCTAPVEEAKVPLNVLPESGQPVFYEFYTDS